MDNFAEFEVDVYDRTGDLLLRFWKEIGLTFRPLDEGSTSRWLIPTIAGQGTGVANTLVRQALVQSPLRHLCRPSASYSLSP